MTEPDLRDLTTFVAVARHRSFRRAARELGVSVSSLSQRLRDLEARLGVRLLNRTTRSVAPTEAGERLLDEVGPALRAVGDALDRTRSRPGEPSGRLRINAPAPAADLVLRPMIPAFLAAHPRVDVEIVVEAALVDIVAAGFDAGVRYEETLAQDMVAVPLGPPERYRVVAAPALLAVHGVPEEPEDLLTRPCIGTVFANGTRMVWEFEREGRAVRVTPPLRFTAGLPSLQVEAALAGLGYLATFEGYVRDDIAAGRLVPVLEAWCEPFSGPFLYYPSRRQPPPALAAFVAFVRQWRRRMEGGGGVCDVAQDGETPLTDAGV